MERHRSSRRRARVCAEPIHRTRLFYKTRSASCWRASRADTAVPGQRGKPNGKLAACFVLMSRIDCRHMRQRPTPRSFIRRGGRTLLRSFVPAVRWSHHAGVASGTVSFLNISIRRRHGEAGRCAQRSEHGLMRVTHRTCCVSFMRK